MKYLKRKCFTNWQRLAPICVTAVVVVAASISSGQPSVNRAGSASNSGAQPDEKLSYNRDIRPILSDKCFACHGPDAGSREAELRLDIPTDGKDYFGAYSAITPGDPDASDLISRIHSTKSRLVMPPAKFGVSLTEQEKKSLRLWIEEGAVYEGHWAFEPVAATPLPAVNNKAWARNEIDLFILAELESQQVQPSKPAPLHSLMRRVSLDLTGLPPDPARVLEAECSDHPDQAYEQYVDELLASPRFGERMASIWLDIARYADTHGYLHDNVRTMWPWRDWVIRAYNDNLPYDQFIRDQIAGDLLPEPTRDQLIATGFNRNHAISTEGGSIEEELRVEYAADRTNTLGTAILSLTIECARCHDHKYDPISQEDYFSLFAYFNSVDKEDPVPENSKAAAFAPLMHDEQSGVEVMVMRESEPPRPTFVLDRGQYDSPIKERPVSRHVPNALGSVPDAAPANRLGLAQWLTSSENPLTARVEMNRLWQTFFGTGIVKTSEDFGLQGEWPSHPELLDYLAKRFMDTGWDRKAMVRLIVTSATYRQSSDVRTELAQVDPANRLLARMSRLRLPAETIRDQALAASGLLVNKIGGPGVRPYQPDGLWREGSNQASNTRIFTLGQGEELYRRSIYTFLKRTSLSPQMVLLDIADRNACAVKRSRTNTALQALLLMNDTQHIEAARVLASHIHRSAQTDEARLKQLFVTCLSRDPDMDETKVLLDGLSYYREAYAGDLDSARRLIAHGQSVPDESIAADELAAWTMMTSTLLNLDETVTRP